MGREFMDLPSRGDYPEYYKFVEKPVSFNMIKVQSPYKKDFRSKKKKKKKKLCSFLNLGTPGGREVLHSP